MSVSRKLNPTWICAGLLALQSGCSPPPKAYPQLWRENPAIKYENCCAIGEPGTSMIGEVGETSVVISPTGPRSPGAPGLSGRSPSQPTRVSPAPQRLPPLKETPPRKYTPPTDWDEKGANGRMPRPADEASRKVPELFPDNDQEQDQKGRSPLEIEFYRRLFEPSEELPKPPVALPKDLGFEGWDVDELGISKGTTVPGKSSTRPSAEDAPSIRQVPQPTEREGVKK